MALTDLQKHVMRCLATNRSETSYVAGGVVLNRDWPRRSDDIDVFHDTDEESYLKSAPSDIVGVLAIDGDGTPVTIASLEDVAARSIEFRRATEEPEVMPEPADAACDWANTEP